MANYHYPAACEAHCHFTLRDDFT